MTKEELLDSTADSNDILVNIDHIEGNYDIESSWHFGIPVEENVTGWKDEDEVIALWESCEYRCVVCDEDQCFCEDGYKRKLAHQRDCKACQILYDGGVFIN